MMIDSRMVLPLLLIACTSTDSNARNAASVRQAAQDSVATAVISPEGGTVELEGFATVIFPPRAFDAARPVAVAVVTSPEQQQRYNRDVPPRGRPLPYHIVVRTGRTAPATGFQVVIHVPGPFLDSLPPDHSVHIFAQIVGGGPAEALDDFDPLRSDFDRGAKVVRARVPLRAVRPPRLDDGTVETILLVGSRPQ